MYAPFETGLDMTDPFAELNDLVAGGADKVEDQPGLPSAAVLVQLIKEVNVCGTLTLGVPVDVAMLSALLPSAEHQVKGGFIRCKLSWKQKLGMTAFVFKTGKVTFMGAADEDSAQRAAHEISRHVQDVGYTNARVSGFRVTNRVGKLKLPFGLDLPLLGEVLGSGQTGYKSGANDDGQLGYLTFEPELYPGLRQRVYVDKWVTVTVYHSGSIVMTGARELGQFSRCIERLYPFMKTSCRLPRRS